MIRKRYKLIVGVIIGSLLTATTAYAAYCVWAKDVPFTSSTGLSSANVQDAIDELNLKIGSCPGATPVCRRASNLHKEKCNKSGGCHATNLDVNQNKKITFGQVGTNGTLAVGDAFDCDVNGDGTYDEDTERFYFLKDQGNGYVSLIYYNNTAVYTDPVQVVNMNYATLPFGDNTGPTIAYTCLPPTSAWTNVSLPNGNECLKNYGRDKTERGCFSYSDRAARLVYLSELEESCGLTVNSNGITDGSVTYDKFTGCDFLMENTSFSTVGHMGPSPADGYYIHDLAGNNYGSAEVMSDKTIEYNDTSNYYAVRPVIEVKKIKISY